jgi:hypothetical protein
MEDGAPRYVGRTSDEVSYCFKQHVTTALEKEPSSVYDWMRDVWRCGFDVGVHTLQEAVVPKDLEMFEQYWIDQFSNLLNRTNNNTPKQDSAVGQAVKSALVSQLQLTRKTTM